MREVCVKRLFCSSTTGAILYAIQGACMNRLIISWVWALLSMLVLDGIWLSIMAQRFYMPQLGHLTAATINFVPAAFFYPLYNFGLAYLVLAPALQAHESLRTIFFSGALFGLVAYATYDLTNQTTLKDWSTLLTLVDIAWGTLVTGTVAVLSAAVTNYFS